MMRGFLGMTSFSVILGSDSRHCEVRWRDSRADWADHAGNEHAANVSYPFKQVECTAYAYLRGRSAEPVYREAEPSKLWDWDVWGSWEGVTT